MFANAQHCAARSVDAMRMLADVRQSNKRQPRLSNHITKNCTYSIGENVCQHTIYEPLSAGSAEFHAQFAVISALVSADNQIEMGLSALCFCVKVHSYLPPTLLNLLKILLGYNLKLSNGLLIYWLPRSVTIVYCSVVSKLPCPQQFLNAPHIHAVLQ